MRYAQVKGGQKLHLVFEAGEGWDDQHLVPAGHLSAPICGRRLPPEGYRLTINVPMGAACKNCLRAARAKGL